MRDWWEDATLADSGLRNVQFLLAQQLRVVDSLAAEGRDTTEARQLLRQLMLMESSLRARHQGARAMAAGCYALA